MFLPCVLFYGIPKFFVNMEHNQKRLCRNVIDVIKNKPRLVYSVILS